MPLKIEINAAGKFIIVRERKYENDLAFTMFVDATKTSWTSKGFFAQQFASREGAQEALDEIKRRNKIRRKQAAENLEEK